MIDDYFNESERQSDDEWAEIFFNESESQVDDEWPDIFEKDALAELAAQARHEQTITVPRETLERWMEDLHRVGLTLSSTRAALGIRDELKAMLSEKE